MQILEHEFMNRHTTFRVGGPARFFCIPETEEELAEIVARCTAMDLPFTIVGRGSNLLVADRGYLGVVIHVGDALAKAQVKGTTITAQAGISLAALASYACRMYLTGLEFAAGIPGSFGGALLMNAGAYGGEMKDVVRSLRLMDPDGTIREVDASWMEYDYRTSRAQKEGSIIVGATLELRPGDPKVIQAKMQELAARRREKQPLEYPSAGSYFKRPKGRFAGALIEQAGLKGFRVGGAQVSEKHAGFVINAGNATAADIAALQDEVVRQVRERFGVTLEPEVKRLGNFR
ncbi:MAG: UDP-N-acetylmuramate dehydrogenase [Lachnospiraceae bacterium]|nr:UDP-N-acetylmuramate dehydrogenase [Lachnospiraceae bacterium]